MGLASLSSTPTTSARVEVAPYKEDAGDFVSGDEGVVGRQVSAELFVISSAEPARFDPKEPGLLIDTRHRKSPPLEGAWLGQHEHFGVHCSSNSTCSSTWRTVTC